MNKIYHVIEKVDKIQIKLDKVLSTVPKEIQLYINSLNQRPATEYQKCLELKNFYEFTQENTNSTFPCEYMTINDLNNYQHYLEGKISNNELSIKWARKRFKLVKKWLNFLFQQNIIKFQVDNSRFDKGLNGTITYPVVKVFLEELKFLNYSQLDPYRKNIQYFLNYISKEFNKFDFMNIEFTFEVNKLNMKHIDSYHDFLAKRVSLEEISKISSLRLLATLKLFFRFLNRKNFNSLKYSIPEKFRCSSSRENEYAFSEEIVELLEYVMSNSQTPIKNLTIILILLDTGCRPLEVINLKLQDIFESESCIVLRSKKSGQRKLKLDKHVMEYLNAYLVDRKQINVPDEQVFLNRWGNPMSAENIQSIFYKRNNAFRDKRKITAKTLRHTFITNALDNKYSLEFVGQVAGHKHKISTQYYLEKSLRRLLNNTLPYEPY